MYHILGFIAVILGLVFICTVGTYDYKLGIYLGQIYTAVILFFMIGLITLAKKFLRKPGGGEDGEAQPGELCKGEEKRDKQGMELYLISERHDDMISYRVENEEKAAEYEAVGRIINERVSSIKLCIGKPDPRTDILVARENGAKEYTVWEGEQVLGTVMARKNRLFFAGIDGIVRYSTNFAGEDIPEEEEAIEGIMTLVSLGMTSRGAKANTLVIYGPDDAVLGKYFPPLRNLELFMDGNEATNRRLAIVLAIMADVKFQLAKSRGKRVKKLFTDLLR